MATIAIYRIWIHAPAFMTSATHLLIITSVVIAGRMVNIFKIIIMASAAEIFHLIVIIGI